MTNSLEKCPLTLSERKKAYHVSDCGAFSQLKEALQNRGALVQKDPAYPEGSSLKYMFRLLLFMPAVNKFLINLEMSFPSPQFRFLTKIP